jgi:hypothetical protein
MNRWWSRRGGRAQVARSRPEGAGRDGLCSGEARQAAPYFFLLDFLPFLLPFFLWLTVGFGLKRL